MKTVDAKGLKCPMPLILTKRALLEMDLDYEHKMLMMDAQTSGGLLICCDPGQVREMLEELSEAGYGRSAVVGEVLPLSGKHLVV